MQSLHSWYEGLLAGSNRLGWIWRRGHRERHYKICGPDHYFLPGARVYTAFRSNKTEPCLLKKNLCTLSYSCGPSRPLLDLTIGGLLERTASRFPDRLAVASCHQQKRLTWAELSAEADRVARGLWSLGIRRGDRVGLWSTNCIEWVMMHMGCARAGAALVNVNPAYRSHELQFTLQRSRMKALFLWHKDKRADYEEILGRARHGLTLALEHTIYFDSPEWPALLDAEGRLPDRVAVDDVANIQYTSGTTGLPKGVMLTHHNVVNNGQFLAQGFHYTEQDSIVVPVPLFHCFGCVIGTMSAVNSGAAIILPNWTFDPRATLQAVHDERATSVYGVPAMYVAELALPDFASFDLTSLRTGMMSGAPCPVELMKRVLNEMHCRELVIAYGQTETSPVVTMSDADDPIEIRVNTVGRAMPQTEIQIVSTATGEPLPVGEQGEVCVRGYALMKGYDGDPEETAQVIKEDGWLRTGDLGIMHQDGCIHLTGRSKRRDYSRRRKHLSPRGGGVSLHPSQGGRGAGGGHSQCAAGRDCRRLGAAEARRRSDRRGDQGVLQRPDRLLQDSRTRSLRHRVSGDAERQNTKVQNSRVRD